MKHNLLTIALDDYFHAGALKPFIKNDQWHRFEMRIEQNTLSALAWLDQFDVKATFFVMGWIADNHSDLVRKVAERGHEIANLGYYHRTLREMSATEFEEDLLRSAEALQRATGQAPRGYRLARPVSDPKDLWFLEVLAKHGYKYDSSVMPLFRSLRVEPSRRVAHENTINGHSIWEFPFSTWDCMGYSVPISGGNYLRQFPERIMQHTVARWMAKNDSPYLLYFHVWDIDPDQPKITAAPRLARIRAYRNLNKMRDILGDYLKRYKFGTVADYLGLPAQEECVVPSPSNVSESVLQTQAAADSVPSDPAPAASVAKTPITIVIPCFNEENSLTYLSNTLKGVSRRLNGAYDVNFTFLDDGSHDATWPMLQQVFGSRPDCTLVRQERNLGVAGTIMNGIEHARTEIVCSMDCDCTYDPEQLAKLIPLLTEGVAMVTGSPYHPDGEVRNVPNWRLFLSRGASWLYGKVLHQKLATYTSCFRVYRRSALVGLQLDEGGFLGVAEMLGLLDLRGERIVECPTVLDVRMFGQSKMKILRTVFGHLRLLLKLATRRKFRAPTVVSPRKDMLTSSSHQS
jgi:polysaccharide deacetylase family protein (PEP-CTERM system associated)